MSAQSRHYILANYTTMSIQQMADALKRPYNQVWRFMKSEGIIEVKEPNYDEYPYSAILKLYIEGWYIEDIAERVAKSRNFCANVIHRVFRTYNLNTRSMAKIEEPDRYINPEKQEE